MIGFVEIEMERSIVNGRSQWNTAKSLEHLGAKLLTFRQVLRRLKEESR